MRYAARSRVSSWLTNPGGEGLGVLALCAALTGCGPASPGPTEPTRVDGPRHEHSKDHVHEHFHAHEDGMGHAHEHGHGPLVHRFDDAEKWAREFDDPGRDAWQKPDEVVRLLALEPGMVVADLGAGTGYFMARLSRAVGDKGTVYALDVEDDMVRYLAARAKKERLGNVLVLVVDTWHHIPSRSTYVPKLARGLRKGGLLLVVDFTKDAKHGPPPAHRLEAESVKRELEQAGLEASVVPSTLREQWVVAGRKR
jgi:SAM-dependent methyltransferase